MSLFPSYIPETKTKSPRPFPYPTIGEAEQLGLPIPKMDTRPLQASRPVVRGATLAERFNAFHEVNPQVYENLRMLAITARRSGQGKASIKQFYEVLRYSVQVTTREQWNLNNDYTSLYARLLMEKEPELRGFFDLRERRKL